MRVCLCDSRSRRKNDRGQQLPRQAWQSSRLPDSINRHAWTNRSFQKNRRSRSSRGPLLAPSLYTLLSPKSPRCRSKLSKQIPKATMFGFSRTRHWPRSLKEVPPIPDRIDLASLHRGAPLSQHSLYLVQCSEELGPEGGLFGDHLCRAKSHDASACR